MSENGDGISRIHQRMVECGFLKAHGKGWLVDRDGFLAAGTICAIAAGEFRRMGREADADGLEASSVLMAALWDRWEDGT